MLDVGAGYGEPGLSAAAAVGPTGHVTCLDISGDMLAFAERRARRAGLANVEFVEADIESHALDPVSFDAVLSRAVLMYASDPLGTLRRLRAPSARRPYRDRRLGRPERSPSPPPGDGRDGRHRPSASPGPGPFALGRDGLLAELVRSAGFEDVRSGTVVVIYEKQTPRRALSGCESGAPPITELVANLPADVQENVWTCVTDAWAPFQDDTGKAVRLPCTAIWVRQPTPVRRSSRRGGPGGPSAPSWCRCGAARRRTRAAAGPCSGEALRGPLPQLARAVAVDPCGQADRGHGHLAQLASSGRPTTAASTTSGMLLERRLDLDGVHRVAARLDHVLAAAGEHDGAERPAASQVAGAQPAVVGERGRRVASGRPSSP